VARLADIAGRVWKGEVRGIIYAIVDRDRRVYPRFFLLNSPDCKFDNHMPVAMAQYLMQAVQADVGQVQAKKEDPD
jgi:hypothetical protein